MAKSTIDLQKWVASYIRANNIVLGYNLSNNVFNFDSVAFNALQLKGSVYVTDKDTLPVRFELLLYVPLFGNIPIGSAQGPLKTTADEAATNDNDGTDDSDSTPDG
ncbi:hypothetical protein FRC17_007537, partial [Serendipita sp. 399]